MKAAEINHFGDADALYIADVPEPHPNKKEVLVEVHASSINPFDSKMRKGIIDMQFCKRLPVTLGSDVAGIIQQSIDGLRAGDRVYGQASVIRGASGAFAEYAAVPRDLIARMPDNLSFVEAASIVLVGTSALQALHDHVNLKPGQHILIHGAAGGIGTAAVQLAKYFGAKVTATAAGEATAYVKWLGADRVIDFEQEDFVDELSNVDAVLDTVGGETYQRSFRVLKPDGIIVSLLEKTDGYLVERYGVKAMYQSTQVDRRHLNELTTLLEQGALLVHVGETYSLDHIRDAFEAKELGHIHGKVGITIQ